MVGGNVQKVHRAMYTQAIALLMKEDDAKTNYEGLDMLLEMRLMPDLSLYRRALVNLSISQGANDERYDCKKFADEALRICQEIKRRYLPAGETHADLIRIEETARATLADLLEAEAILVKEGKKVFPPFVPDLSEESHAGAGLVEYNPKQIEGSCYSTMCASYDEHRKRQEERKARYEESERVRKLKPMYGKLQEKRLDTPTGNSSDKTDSPPEKPSDDVNRTITWRFDIMDIDDKEPNAELPSAEFGLPFSPEMQVKPGAFSSTLSTTSDLPSGSTKATTVDNTIASSGDNYMDKEVPSDDDML